MSRSKPVAEGDEITLDAPAKVNLWLHVLGREDDGFHRIDTVFQSLELADRVTVACRPASGPEVGAEGCVALEIVGDPCPTGPGNLCVRAARAFLQRWPEPVAVRVRLEKRVPMAAGLGGGSSDAASVLLGLRRLLGHPATVDELVEPARALGADVPYFLVGGTARGRGRGDRLEALPDLEPRDLWLFEPRRGLPTAEVFAHFAETGRAGSAARKAEIDLPEDRVLDGWIRGNDLEASARALCPELNPIYTAVQRLGFGKVQLSGSGGVVFGTPPDGLRPARAARELGAAGRLHVTRTRPRGDFGSI